MDNTTTAHVIICPLAAHKPWSDFCLPRTFANHNQPFPLYLQKSEKIQKYGGLQRVRNEAAEESTN